MRRTGFAKLVMVGIAATVIATVAVADDTPKRVEIRRVAVPGSTTHEVIVGRLEIGSGDVIPRHTHNGDEHMVVLEGGDMQTADGKIVSFLVGSTAYFPQGQVHGGLTNTGDATLVVLTTHIVEVGKPLYVPAD